MSDTCKICTKPAVTLCLKGRLCHKCGLNCHQDYRHPVQFIRHSKTNTAQTTRKTNIIASSSLKVLPKRLTKVAAKLSMTRLQPAPSQSCSRKMTESSFAGKENREVMVNIKERSVAESSLAESKKSVVLNDGGQNEALRRRLEKQQGVIRLLLDKLKREKEEKKTMRAKYQDKLRFIRQLRQ